MNINWIPIADCHHGGLYSLDSRNLTLGIYCMHQQGFIGIRVKFNARFLFLEHHWDCGPPCGTAKPMGFIEMYPFDDIVSGHKTEGRWGWLENATMRLWLEERENA